MGDRTEFLEPAVNTDQFHLPFFLHNSSFCSVTRSLANWSWRAIRHEPKPIKITNFGCLKLYSFQIRYLRIDHCAVAAAGGLNGPAPSHNDRTADPIFALSLTLIVMVMIYGCLSIFAAPVHTGIYAQNLFHSSIIAVPRVF